MSSDHTLSREDVLKASGQSVRTISAQDLRIERAGRVLLNIPKLQLGAVNCSAIVGPNGAGKSLLVKSLSALSLADTGQVLWEGTAPNSNRRFQVGLLLQRPVLLNRTALNNVIFALQSKGMQHKEALEAATDALESAGLGALINVSAQRLSGGEQQRLALARALALKPDMLFLDEATANVDPASTLAIEQQLGRAIEGGLGVVLVSHDMGQVKRLADEVILMNRGELVEQSSRSDFFEHTINPVTRSWLAGEILL
jgi:tungstate transport system ATP-binding protein